jgi:hypothetical protein
VACLELYETTYDACYIQTARELMQLVVKNFSSESGAFYETTIDAEKLLVRQTSGYDGVEPSGNSNAALAFLKLSAYLIDPELTKKAENIFLSFSGELMEYGLNSAYDDEVEKNAKIIPLLESRKLYQGKAVAYVCHQGTCLPPVQTSEELVKLLSYE